MPDELRQAAEPILERCRGLVPPWMARVWLVWNRYPPGTAQASSDTCVEYRYGRIVFYPAWLDESPEGRERIVIHECLHFSVSPLADWVELFLPRVIKENDPLLDTAKDEIQRRLEAAVTDLTTIVQRHSR